MAKYSVMFDTNKNGILSFTAVNDEEAIEIYEKLINEDIFPEDLDDVEHDVENGSASYYELRSGQGKLVSE
jgi:hypothetical protein